MRVRRLQCQKQMPVLQGREIGEGTYGVVHLAWDTELQCSRAIKLFKKDDGDVAECALRELAFQRLLTSGPSIASLLSVLVQGSDVAMLMPAYEQDLADAIDDADFGCWRRVRPAMLDLLAALQYMHSWTPPIMHRDVKPENVLMDSLGRAYLTDFGFARFTVDRAEGPLSHGSNQRGTSCYNAPEILQHGRPHTPLVDVWSAGIIAVELLKNDRLSASTDRTAQKQALAFAQDSPHKQLLLSMLCPEEKRCTAAEARAALNGKPLAAPAPFVMPAAPVPRRLAAAVRHWTQRLAYHCPMTFTAACAYCQGKRANALLAVMAAGKLYEHSYWSASELVDTLQRPTLLDEAVRFQLQLVQECPLLLPFTTPEAPVAGAVPNPAAQVSGAACARRRPAQPVPAPLPAPSAASAS